MMTRWLAFVGASSVLFLAEWRDVAAVYAQSAGYYLSGPFPLTFVTAVAVAVLGMGTVLTVGVAAVTPLTRRLRPVARDRLLTLAVAAGLATLWMSATRAFLGFDLRVAGSVFLLGGGIYFVLQPAPEWLRRLGLQLFAVSTLTLPAFLLPAAAQYFAYPFQADHVAPRLILQPSPGRVVWVVFDELDASVALSTRPGEVTLASFDRLKAESFEATRAYAPGRWTIDAMPTLWTGRPVTEARPLGPSRLSLTFADSPNPVDFEPGTSVFSRAHAAGAPVGVAGWHHPYCRLFREVVVDCVQEPNESADFAIRRAGASLQGGMRRAVLELVARHAPLSIEGVLAGGLSAERLAVEEAYSQARRGSIYRRIHKNTLRMVTDPRLSLVFAHYPIPHLPKISDQLAVVSVGSADQAYFDNLRLVDRTLHDVRSALEASGLWHGTTLVVQSDHALRPTLWAALGAWGPALQAMTQGRQSDLTPFVLKLAGAGDTRVEYQQPFNTALAADIVIGILEGRLRQYADVIAWLDANRGRLPLTWPVKVPLGQ